MPHLLRSSLTRPAGRHVELQNGYFKLRMLIQKFGLRLWEPRPSEQGGFWLRSLYVLFRQLLPGQIRSPDPMRSGRRPSGIHPSRCLAPMQAAGIPDAVLRRHKLLPASGNKGAWRGLAPA